MISKVLGVAKKLSTTGFDLVNHVAPGSVAPLKQAAEHHSVIHIHDNEKTMTEKMTEKKHSENPQQMFRTHVPKVTQQLLGRHYSKVNNVASLISPNLNNKIADFFFDKLNDFVSESSSVEHVLKEVGAKELTELSKDSARSDRVAQALANQNKTLAIVQGAITGASGVIGTAIDIPLSLALTLRTIYQSGRAHGFELNRSKEQEIVEYVFKEVDLGSIAEKQTLLIALRTLANVLQTQDTRQLQTMLGSSNDFDKLRQWLSNEDGTLKWSWLNHIPQISVLSKLTPLAGAGIGAIYSWKLVDEASVKAQHIFSHAQQYLLQHPDEKLDVLSAFEKGVAKAQAQGVLSSPEQETAKQINLKTDALVEPDHPITVELENEAISAVRVEHKSDAQKEESVSIEEGIKKLAEQHVEPHENDTNTESSVAEQPEENQQKKEAASDETSGKSTVFVEHKSDTQKEESVSIEEGIKKLAEQHVEPHENDTNTESSVAEQTQENQQKKEAAPDEISGKGEAGAEVKVDTPKVVVKKKTAKQVDGENETSSITKKPQS